MAFQGVTKFYDPDQVAITFAGILIGGYADDEFITIEQMSPTFASVVGTDGAVSRSKSNDRRLKVVIKLMQTSSTNLALSAIHNLDRDSPNGAGVAPFQMVDMQGNTLISGSQAWITKMPEDSMARTAKSREWEIEVSNGLWVEGGN